MCGLAIASPPASSRTRSIEMSKPISRSFSTIISPRRKRVAVSRSNSASIAGILWVDPVAEDVEARAVVFRRELDPGHEIESELARRGRRLLETVERVVIGERDAREVALRGEHHHLGRTKRSVGAVRVRVKVVSAHRGKGVRPSASPSTPAADAPRLDCERARRSRGPVPRVRAAAAPGRAAAPAARVVAVLRARRRAQGRGLPLRQRGRPRQRRDRVDVLAAGHHDRERSRRARDLPRRRHGRGELPPALRPQRPERSDPAGGPDLRPANRVGHGARAGLHRRGVDRCPGHLLRGPGR